MRWRSQLPKWHPLHREEDPMPISPGTERAIQRLSDHAPDCMRELTKLNANVEQLNENLEKLNSVGGIPGKVEESAKNGAPFF